MATKESTLAQRIQTVCATCTAGFREGLREDIAAHPWQWCVVRWASLVLFQCVLLLLLLVLSGCAETTHWMTRTIDGIDCTPRVVQANNGQCVSLKKGR